MPFRLLDSLWRQALYFFSFTVSAPEADSQRNRGHKKEGVEMPKHFCSRQLASPFIVGFVFFASCQTVVNLHAACEKKCKNILWYCKTFQSQGGCEQCSRYLPTGSRSCRIVQIDGYVINGDPTMECQASNLEVDIKDYEDCTPCDDTLQDKWVETTAAPETPLSAQYTTTKYFCNVAP